MYEYTVTTGQKSTIFTPGCNNFSDIDTEVVSYDGYSILKSTYPNGLYVEMHQYADKIIIKSNRELIKNDDGTFTAPES
nr:MAG TPA: hypothetical protein [Bacteriophage sp.]